MPKYERSNVRQWIRENLSGYMTALYTPFRSDG